MNRQCTNIFRAIGLVFALLAFHTAGLAHVLSTNQISLTFPGPTASFTLANGLGETDCVTIIGIRINGDDVIEVTPRSQTYQTPPVGSATFTVTPLKAGNATITVEWTAGTSPTCNASGEPTITVTVQSATTPPPPPPPPPATLATAANRPFSGSVNEPVSTSTGELFGHELAGLELDGPLPLNFRAYYGAYLKANGVTSAMGTNWMHNYDVKLAVTSTNATVTLFRGKTVNFVRNNNAWQLSGTEIDRYQLVSTSLGYQFFSPVSQFIYTFHSSGALTAIQDRNGNTLTVTQASGGAGPSQVSDGLGRVLTFGYSGSNLSSVTDQTGRRLVFENSSGNLTAWTDENGKRSTIAYTSAGTLTGLMTTETRPAGNQPLTQQYNSEGRVIRQTDSFGNAMTLAYSDTGATVTEPLGVVLTHAHDAQGNLTSLADPRGVSSKYTYDANGRPLSTTDRTGAAVSVTYDTVSGLPSRVTDELGFTTVYTYAPTVAGGFTFYDLATVVFPDGGSLAFTRDGKGNVTGLTDPSGKIWNAAYNTRGQVATLTNPSGSVTTFNYGTDGMLISTRTDFGDVTQIAYDSAKRPNLITQPDNTTEKLEYDARSNLVRLTDERDNSVTAAFDNNNDLRTVTDALSAATTFSYDTNGRLISLSDAQGKVTAQAFDAGSRLTSVTDPTGVRDSYSYNTLNHLTSAVDTTGKGFTFGRDAEGRLTSTADALNRTTVFTLNARGEVTGITTPKGEKYTIAYDSMGRRLSTTDPMSRVTRYTYDLRGLITGINHPGAISLGFARNELGLITAVTDPRGNQWRRTYDKMGRLASTIDPLGRTAAYQYDSRQRVSGITLPLGSVQFTYDAAGNLTRETYSDGVVRNYAYDANGRLTSTEGLALVYDTLGRIVSSNGILNAWDAAGRLASVTYAAGKTVTYTYDNRGLLIRIADWLGGVTTFAYNDAQELVAVSWPNGIRQEFTNDANGKPITLRILRGNTLISSETVSRDALGRVASVDFVPAVIGAVQPGIGVQSAVTAVAGEAGGRHAVGEPDLPQGNVDRTFDPAGQIVGNIYTPNGFLSDDGVRKLNWNIAGDLLRISTATGSSSFEHNGLGYLTGIATGGTERKFVLNLANPIPSVAVITDGSGAAQFYNITMPNGTPLYNINAAINTPTFVVPGLTNRLVGFNPQGNVSFTVNFGPTGETGIRGDVDLSNIFVPTPQMNGFVFQDLQLGTAGQVYDPITADGLSGGDREADFRNARDAFSEWMKAEMYPDSAYSRIQSFNNRIPQSLGGAPQVHSLQELLEFTAPRKVLYNIRTSASQPLAPIETILPLEFSPYWRPQDAASLRSNLTSTAPGEAPTTRTGEPVQTRLPIPRFADVSSLRSSFQTNLCRTNPLFPFITNQSGFDTGIAIANTSRDPFATPLQTGTCTLNAYGRNAPAIPINNPQQTVASTSTTYVAAAACGFQGYIIAQCNFQYAHGFAFIGDAGAQKLAEGYLSLILDSSNGPSRAAGSSSESLGQ